MHLVSSAFGLVGCLILTYGVAVAAFHWLRVQRMFWVGEEPQNEHEALHYQLAYYLLVSLEFLMQPISSTRSSNRVWKNWAFWLESWSSGR